ncbi:MAG: hypothetical protein WAQ05_18795 [Rubrivivax sp.]
MQVGKTPLAGTARDDVLEADRRVAEAIECAARAFFSIDRASTAAISAHLRSRC